MNYGPVCPKCFGGLISCTYRSLNTSEVETLYRDEDGTVGVADYGTTQVQETQDEYFWCETCPFGSDNIAVFWPQDVEVSA